MSIRVPGIACACALALASSLSGQRADSLLAAENLTVIDGTGGPARARHTILIRNGRIADVYPTGSKPVPAGALRRDMTGLHVIPGLIDAHVHITTPYPTRAGQDVLLGFLFNGGVTSVRDMAGDVVSLSAHQRRAVDAAVPTPRIYYSAVMAGSSFFASDSRPRAAAHGMTAGAAPWLRAIDDSTDLRLAMEVVRWAGATGVKLYADLAPRFIERVSAEAIRQELRVWSHATIFPARPGDAVRAGVHVLSHANVMIGEAFDSLPLIAGYRYAYRYDSIPVDHPAIVRVIREMARRGTMLEPTLVTSRRQSVNARRDTAQFALWNIDQWSRDLTRAAHREGVAIVAGTDLMGSPATDSLPLIHDEMELLVQGAGLTPLEAIRAATLNAARAIGIDSAYGSIEAGKVADLVVLRADPTADIANTRSVALIIKEGRAHPRVRPATPDTTPRWVESWTGTQIAVMAGALETPGQPFRFLFRMPADYWIPPHTHPVDATIRVVTGQFRVGAATDTLGARVLGPGESIVLARGMAHFEATTTATVIEVSGVGPWGISFVDPTAQPGIRPAR